MTARAAIKFGELKSLPFTTLCAFALALAAEIQNGAEEKRALLERVFSAIRSQV